MSLQTFLLCLLIVSTMTGLIVEALKNIMTEWNMNYHANTLAGVVAVVLSAGVGVAYSILAETKLNEKLAVILIALMLLSWLCAMVGYDKVVQAIMQFAGGGKNPGRE